MKAGDLIWQDRVPGGVCIVLEVIDSPEAHAKTANHGCGWAKIDYPILRIHHPTEGIIEDPRYYYNTWEDIAKQRERNDQER